MTLKHVCFAPPVFETIGLGGTSFRIFYILVCIEGCISKSSQTIQATKISSNRTSQVNMSIHAYTYMIIYVRTYNIIIIIIIIVLWRPPAKSCLCPWPPWCELPNFTVCCWLEFSFTRIDQDFWSSISPLFFCFGVSRVFTFNSRTFVPNVSFRFFLLRTLHDPRFPSSQL